MSLKTQPLSDLIDRLIIEKDKVLVLKDRINERVKKLEDNGYYRKLDEDIEVWSISKNLAQFGIEFTL